MVLHILSPKTLIYVIWAQTTAPPSMRCGASDNMHINEFDRRAKESHQFTYGNSNLQ